MHPQNGNGLVGAEPGGEAWTKLPGAPRAGPRGQVEQRGLDSWEGPSQALLGKGGA